MVPREETPSMQFWKKSPWPMPQPLITPRPVTTTRFFSALRDVDDAREVDVTTDAVRRVKPLAVEMPMARRAVDVVNFIVLV